MSRKHCLNKCINGIFLYQNQAYSQNPQNEKTVFGETLGETLGETKFGKFALSFAILMRFLRLKAVFLLEFWGVCT